MSDLVVIEAPGKLRAMRAALASCGWDARVVATVGHLRGYSQRLTPLGIHFNESGQVIEDRGFLRENVARYVEAAIRDVKGRVIVACDMDQEGHSIAHDVVMLSGQVRPDVPVLRLPLSSIDGPSIAVARERMGPVHLEDALAGQARRIADRVFAAQSQAESGRAVGRVQLGLLQLASQGRLVRRVIVAPVRAHDGGAPFVLKTEVPAHVGDAAALEAVKAIPAVRTLSVQAQALSVPLDAGESLLLAESKLGLSIEDAAKLLQELYEDGKISYPRTGERRFSGMSVESMARLARLRGVTAYRPSIVPKEEADGHEAIRVLGEPELLRPAHLARTQADALVVLLGRRMLECGIAARHETGSVASEQDWLNGASATRVVALGRPPWGIAGTDRPMIQVRSVEAACVSALIANGMAKPSTYSRHAVRLAASGWLDEGAALSPEGWDVLERFPGEMRVAAASPAFDRAIEGIGSVQDRVDVALQALGAEPLGRWSGDAESVPEIQPAAEFEIGPEFEDEEDAPAYRLVR